MKIFPEAKIRNIGYALFRAAGVPEEQTRIVVDELVEASLMGLDSHGVMRVAQYLNDVKNGSVKLSAPIEVIYETPNSAIVDANFSFGMVSAVEMTRIAIEKATKNHIAVVTSRRCNHVGRLGKYTQRIAGAGLFGFATANAARGGHSVVPFGGSDPRLATNPLSYAVPTSGDPILLDMSTSSLAEGTIRKLLQQGKRLPEACVLDGDGNPTDDPAKFYGPPRGAILPFGGPFAYKGFALSLLVELLGSAMSGVGPERSDYCNGLFLLAIHPAIFGAADTFVAHIDGIKEFILSSPPAPGSRGAVMPGGLDFNTRRERLTHGIPVHETTWATIVEAGKPFGVDAEELANRQ